MKTIKKATLFSSFLLVSLPVAAQININDDGHVGIGVNPQYQRMLNVQCDGCNQWIGYGIYSDVRNVNQAAYGVYARAESPASTRALQGRAISDGHFAYGVHATANSSSALYNYGIRAQAGNASSNNWAGYFSGDVTVTGNFSQGSDGRFKQDIVTLDGGQMLDRIQQVTPRSYRYLTEVELEAAGMPVFGTQEGEHLGVIAQELEEVFPELVFDVPAAINDEEGSEEETVITKAVNYTGLLIALLATVQEQQARIEVLENMMQE